MQHVQAAEEQVVGVDQIIVDQGILAWEECGNRGEMEGKAENTRKQHTIEGR